MKRRKLFALLMTAAMAVSSMSMAVNALQKKTQQRKLLRAKNRLRENLQQ